LKTDQGNSCGEWSPVEFLALISHELRSPIQAILGWAEIVESGPIDHETSAHAIQVIKRNAKRQVEMISQLTHFSRLNLGGLSLGSQPVVLGPIIEAAIETMTPQAQAKSVNLQAVVDPFEDAIIGDQAVVRFVLHLGLRGSMKSLSLTP
jgi:signal transduction histidine kinase